jgi:hypothetical protein
MSKTTKHLGKPLYVITLRCDWGVKPSDALLRNWARLDKYAKQDHNRPYDALTDAQKVQTHYNINAGIYKAQEKLQREEERKNHKSVQTPANPA